MTRLSDAILQTFGNFNLFREPSNKEWISIWFEQSVISAISGAFGINIIFFIFCEYSFRDLFIKTYKDLENIIIKLNDITVYDDCCKKVYEWSTDLYSDFDKVAFEDFLLPKINIKNKNAGSKVYRK